jgi:hypothetical protein
MRAAIALALAVLFAPPALAADQIECSQIPHAQSFIDGLKPGPNTKAAQRHLDAAKNAKSDKECVTELGKVNYYAKRSAAADARLAKPTTEPAAPKATKPAKAKVKTAKAKSGGGMKCADTLHQDRPGGSDYTGKPVPGCKRVM